MITKKIIVQDIVLLKEGETNGRKWTLAALEDENGDRYTTFKPEKYQKGEIYEIVYEEKETERNGKVYKDKRIVEKNEKQSANAEIFALLREVNRKLDALMKYNGLI